MSNKVKIRQSVKEHLQKVSSPKDIYELFLLLNYPKEVLFPPFSTRKKENFDFKKEDLERIEEIYSILSFGKDLTKGENLPVFLVESKTLTPSFIRSVTKKFAESYLKFLLIFTVDYNEVVFVFPDYERVSVGEPKLKITRLTIDRQDIHYTDVEILSNLFFDNEKNWRDVWRKWKEAFKVEKVTEKFFEDYTRIFFRLREYVLDQGLSRKEAHEFTLQLLNRIMFIYFISKKKWLGNIKFMRWLWKEYKISREKDLFYEKWLKQIFFKAFNNRSSEIEGLPESVKQTLLDAPFLNGGLFNKNELDDLPVKIDDNLMKEIIDFFEKYNFTIKEDMPLDREVAVDPQMLGYVYESLANVAEEIYDRNDLGIFYTPRVEVDFMCRRSLVEYLSKHLDIPKDKIYHLVFDPPEEKEKIEEWINEEGLRKYSDKEKIWREIEYVLDNLSVVDPACGSGAFLVGMLNVLTELYKLVYKHTGRHFSDFQLKYRIVQRSLYGVDVMPWAIHAAELRLWLQLIVETEFSKEELRKHPLLPNLNMNLRIGDSLVQEIGGISFNIRKSNLKLFLKKKLEELKEEKKKYFENSPTAKFKTPEEIRQEEIRLFQEIIDERIESLKNDIESLENEIKRRGKQIGLFGAEINVDSETYKKEKEKIGKIEREIEKKEKEIEKLKRVKELLHDPEKKPFVWDIDFAEIFGDKGGFDIVIGNPPYVRQEKISPPNKTKAEVTLQDRREYKEKLIKSVKNIFPVVNKIDRKSDYYIYFYFHGLGLLNEKGTFCFITSNSWLDVGYGKDLQEFLLKYVPIIAIYDNPKRSFEHADVNTIIALFGAPVFNEKKIEGLKAQEVNGWPMLNHVAKFVMFKKPFEQVVNAKNLIEIEDIDVKVKDVELVDLVENVVNTNDYRVFPVTQKDLLEDGWGYPEDYDKSKGRFKAGKYEGNKWGGKFLRAPDIFYTILKKGKGKLVRLGDIAEVRFGIKTGANDFFYLPSKYFDLKDEGDYYRLIPKQEGLPDDIKIEKEFLKPVIKSPRECKSIIINPNDLKYKVFVCHKSKSELRGTGALKYIEWGEKQKYHKKPTCASRQKWWDLRKTKISQALCMMSYNDRHIFWKNNQFIVDARFYDIYSDVEPDKLVFSLNSIISFLNVELNGRVNLGEGALDFKVYEAYKIYILDPSLLDKSKINNILIDLSTRETGSIFKELGIDPSKPIREQEPNPLPDRAKLDKVIFDELFNFGSFDDGHVELDDFHQSLLDAKNGVNDSGEVPLDDLYHHL